MSINLPQAIDAYFAADRGNSEEVARCFTENAVVKDEGQTYNGLVAIKQWKRIPQRNTPTRASPSRAKTRTARPSSPAG